MGLKIGTTDIADIRIGTTAVQEVRLGTTKVWPSSNAPPALLDFFTYNTAVNSSITSLVVPAGKTIPVGSMLVIATVINGINTTFTAADNADDPGTANSYARRSGTDWVQGTNATGAILLAKVTREIDAGETITVNMGAARNRRTAIVAWFSGVFPDNSIDGSEEQDEGNSGSWSVPAQGTPASGPTLDLALTMGAATPQPWGFGGGFTKIADVITAAGSSERGGALGYRVSTSAGARSASGTLNTSAVWGAGLLAVDYTP